MSAKLDLVGQKFNKLEVLEFAYVKNQKTYWKCRCDCNYVNLVVIAGAALKYGSTKSCGCLNHESNVKDITGNKYNHLTVIKFSHVKKDKAYWLCKCDCPEANEIIVRNNSLQSGHKKHCGCIKNISKRIDLTGQTFNRLLVLEFFHIKNNRMYWLCRCSCPEKTIKIIDGSHMKAGRIKSCGCIDKENREKRCFKNGSENPMWNPDREYIKLRKKMSQTCGDLVKRSLKLYGKNKDRLSKEMLGYTKEELTKHLGITCVEDLKGMNIDHIFPVKAFCDYGIFDTKIINSLDNLQLLSAEENGSKSDSYDPTLFELYLQIKGITPY